MTEEQILALADAWDDDEDWGEPEPPEPSRIHSPAERLAWLHYADTESYYTDMGG